MVATDVNSTIVNYGQPLSNSELVICSLLAGATAGGLAKTIIAPLDRTKISFQISKDHYSMKKAWQFLIRTYQNEGLVNLWRGNSATMARVVPYAAIQFTAHEQWKQILKVDSKKKEDDSNFKRFLAGSLAGVTSQTLTYPLDLARARMAVTNKMQYKNLRQVFVQIWKTEGIMAFYHGYIPTMLGIIPYAGTSFFMYGTLRKMFTEKSGNKPSPIVNLLFGAISGIIGQSTSYPLDIVRRRAQTASLTGHQRDTILRTLQKIYREEGIKKGFFKGLSMNWIKGPTAVGVSFATYDFIKDLLTTVIIKIKKKSTL